MGNNLFSRAELIDIARGQIPDGSRRRAADGTLMYYTLGRWAAITEETADNMDALKNMDI